MATNQSCALSWRHSLHMPNPLSASQAIWATYCFLSSCASLKFFLECPFRSQVLFLVWKPRSWSLVQQSFLNLYSDFTSSCCIKTDWPDQLFLGFHRLRARTVCLLAFPDRLLLARFQFVFYAIIFKGEQSLWLCFKMISFWGKPHSLWVFF